MAARPSILSKRRSYFSPLVVQIVDQSSRNLVGMFRGDRSMQTVFQSIVPCTNLEISATKSQNGVVENYVFRPKNIWGERPPKSDADVLCPYRDTSSRKVWCNSPRRSRRYQPKYTRILANFRISGVKKLLGADPSPVRCALASVGHPLPTLKFSGGNAPPLRYELRHEHPKKSIEWVESPVLFFAVCGPKFTKFGRHVGE